MVDQPSGNEVTSARIISDPRQRKANLERAQLLHQLLYGSQERFIYFFLAAAGSSIAFALAHPPNLQIKLIVGAFVSWCLSFASGSIHLLLTIKTVAQNRKALEISVHEPTLGEEALTVAYEQAKKRERATSWTGWMQWVLFLGGAALYLAGRLWHHYTRLW